MRVLLTSCPQYGHFLPVVPLTWALRAAGHQVLVAVPENFTSTVEASGLPVTAVGGVLRTRDIMGIGDRSLLDRWATDPREMHIAAIRTVSRFAHHMLEPIIHLCRMWRPDLVLHPELDFTGPLAAAATRVPAVGVVVGPALPAEAIEEVADELGPLCRRHGLAPFPSDSLRLDLWPAALQVAGAPAGRSMRYVPYAGPGTVPAWLREPASAPRGCVTLGSIVPKTGGTALLGPILGALSDTLAETVVVLPDEVLPGLAELGPLPKNIRVLRGSGGPWFPLDSVLGTCDVVVHHGGAGTTLASLTHGLPQLIVPHMADQFTVADSLSKYGAALPVPLEEVSRSSVSEAVGALTTRESFRRIAESLRRDLEREPSPVQIVPLLEELVRTSTA